MPLSEHVHCVAITFRMTEQVEQRICIKFCVKLEHSSAETMGMTQKAFGDTAVSAAQIQVGRKCCQDGREPVESDRDRVLEGLQQAEHLRLWNAGVGLRSAKTGG